MIHENIKSFIFKEKISDHFPIALVFKIGKEETRKLQDTSKKFINYHKLRLDMVNETWSEIYENSDSNVAANIFIDKLKFFIRNNTNEIKKKAYQKVDHTGIIDIN